VWGTVCDDLFSVPAAQVACASLGFSREGYAVVNSFGQATGAINLDDVECVGDEANIGNCVHQPWTTHNCAHTEDVAIVCSSLDVAVRLVDGATANEGRLELFLGGAWGTVCDTGFRDVEAQVACNNLGFDAGQGTFLGNQFGPGTGNIYLDSVVCDGTEAIINECDHSPIGATTCAHDTDVSISCAGASYDVRLVGSTNAYEGRVEILYKGEWGTVCDDLFDANDARVVCNGLGYGFQGYALGNEFGPGTGKIWLDEVDCAGTEPNIGSCAHNPWGVHNCLHSEDVSVSCTPPDVAVRLVGGTDNEGRIEAFVRNEWGTVCDSGFGAIEAGVACTSLGFDEGQGTFLDNQYGPGSGRIFFDHVDCAGGEWSLNECQHSPIGATNCTHAEDVSISCVGNSYDLRLVDGIFPSDGRLEIFYRGVWGTVCDDFFGDAEAQVACSALGYGQGIGRFDGNNPGTGQIWLDTVQCLGWESNPGQCSHDAWGFNDCTHPEDVAISCSTSTGNMYPVRLIGSDGLQAQSSGRLEYSIGGVWGTVCDPDFTDANAQVACYSLGFNQFEGSFIGQTHGSGTGNIWLDNVRCLGSEVMIDDCPHSAWGTVACDHTTDVSIQCVGPWPANPVRLVSATDNSTNPTAGRLEIQYYGTWGTVCDDGFSGTDVGVACASLGFGYVGSVLAGNPNGQGTGKIWLDDMACNGDELSIANCAHSPWGQHNCAHSEDVDISCV
jgi:deleted-in-malignant-brain-tumors protein 1